jgi:hypothetical protein
MVHSVQTVHLSFTEINTFSKQTQMSFHMTHITEEFDRVHPKRSPSILHVWRKSCTYLALRLTLSLKWFLSLWHIQHKPCTNITSRLTPSLTDQNEHPLDWHQLGVPWVWPTQFPCPRYVRHKLCTHLALRLTLSPYRPEWAYTWPTSPRSSIRHTQNDSHAHGTFGANRAPMSRRD